MEEKYMMNYYNNISAFISEITEELMEHPENIVNYDLESDEGMELLRAAAAKNRRVLDFLPDYITSNEYVMLNLISAVPQAIDHCELKFDHSFMFKAIDANPMCYIFAPNWVRSDMELSAEALRKRHYLFDQIAPQLISDMGFAEYCIKSDFRLYPTFFYKRGFTDEEREYLLLKEGRLAGYMTDLFEDRSNAMRIAAANPFVAKCIPEEYRSDREFITELLEKNGLALKYLGNEFRGDRELAITAIKSSPLAYISISDELKADRSFTLQAIRINRLVLKYADCYKNDREMVTEAVKANPGAARYIGDRLRSDNEFMKMLAEEYPGTAKFLSDSRDRFSA